MTTGELLLRLAQALAWPAVALTAVVIAYRALPRDQEKREREETREDQDRNEGQDYG